MKYSVKQDIPGRLRVRLAASGLKTEEAYGITETIRGVRGVLDVKVRAANASVLVTYAPGDTAARDAALSALGDLSILAIPEPIADDAQLDMVREDNDFKRRIVGMVAFRLMRRFLLPAPVRAVITVASAAVFVMRGLRELLRGRLTVEVLDATAIVTALLQRQFNSAANIMFLLRISDVMEEHVNARTRIALQESLLTRAETVWGVREDGTEEELCLESVHVGQLLRVRTGSSVPVDGTVVSGNAEINEASMTGESAVVHKHDGSTVFAGTIVEDGSIVIRVDALPGSSRIDQIVRMVEESSELKAGVQSRAERLSDSLVPFAFLAFIGILAVTRNITKATSVLMVDYSCAIKLSTPVAVMSAMREASSRGCVVKGGKFLESMAAADVVVFDKTGTLTQAAPQVEKVVTMNGESEDELLAIAACLEEHFPHSLARAIVNEAKARGLHHEDEHHTEVEYLVAHGIVSSIDGKETLVGSAHFVFEDRGVERPQGLRERLEQEAPTASTVFLAIDGVLKAAICVADPIRPEAAQVIAQLRALGVKHTVMLTGDSEICARAIADAAGIDEYHAQVLPEDKAGYVEALKESGRRVIMVGDGINDSPALAAANVSVALDDASDIARAVADITFTNCQLESLVVMRSLSQLLMSRINNDYRFIVGFNTALIVLGVAGIIAPTLAAYLHNISTVAVTARNTTPLLPDSQGVSHEVA
jgi:heavy metal translocating P-type ATPase